MQTCLYCGKELKKKSSAAKFCCNSHRVMFSQRRKRQGVDTDVKEAKKEIGVLTSHVKALSNMVVELQEKVQLHNLNTPTRQLQAITDPKSTTNYSFLIHEPKPAQIARKSVAEWIERKRSIELPEQFQEFIK